MADTTGKTKHKRASKGERTHLRRLKEAGRKPGGALAVQMAKVKAAGEVATKKKKDAAKQSPSADTSAAPEPTE